MRPFAIAAAAIVLGSALCASAASAQDSNFALVGNRESPQSPGWVFTPSLVYQGAWDDNALVIFDPQPPSDFLTLVNPRAAVNYNGRLSEFDASYDGAFVLYRQLDGLNSYDQHATVSARRLVTPHIALWARNIFATVPTTELLNFLAVPFVRTGAKLEDIRGGVDAALTKFTSITAAYNFQWAQFDRTQPAGVLLQGGHSSGGAFALKHQISERTALTADYNLQHATVVDGGTFDVQNATAGIERQLLPDTRVFGAKNFFKSVGQRASAC